MGGIGSAFIWTAIASGPVFLILLSLVAAERRLRKALATDALIGRASRKALGQRPRLPGRQLPG